MELEKWMGKKRLSFLDWIERGEGYGWTEIGMGGGMPFTKGQCGGLSGQVIRIL